MSASLTLRVAIVGLCAELVVASTTVLPGAPIFPQWPQFVLFPGIFVVHLRTVLVLSRRSRELSLGDLVRAVPRPLAVGFGALFIVAWVAFLSARAHLGGQPIEQHGRYFLNDHGEYVSVTHAQYLHALVWQQRIFTLIPSVFYALGVLVNVASPNARPRTGDARSRSSAR
jgi:hypothetical protein